jgi:rhodanese-related sulfurtransferase
MGWTCSVTPEALLTLLGGPDWPKIIDVRRSNVYDMAADVLPTAVWRNHREASAWCPLYRDGGRVVVYCAHGEQVSQSAAAALRAFGIDASYLESGISGWLACRGATISREKQSSIRRAGPSRWVASDTPRIDQLASIWLIRRFVDADAGIHFVSNGLSAAIAQEIGAIPIATIDPSAPAAGSGSSLDALIRFFDIADSSLDYLATLVRCSDGPRNTMAAETPGLIAIATGLIDRAKDERQMLDAGLTMFDALYRWVRNQDQGAAGEASTAAQDAS